MNLTIRVIEGFKPETIKTDHEYLISTEVHSVVKWVIIEDRAIQKGNSLLRGTKLTHTLPRLYFHLYTGLKCSESVLDCQFSAFAAVVPVSGFCVQD